jgi:hypothetical protein
MLLRRLIAAELPIADFAAERESLQDLYMSGVATGGLGMGGLGGPEKTP